MSENSKIEWTDHTFNPWIGCTKVSPGCAHCYAETLDRNRYSKTLGAGTKATPVSHWGPGAPRHRTKTWGEPVKWNAQPWICEQCGEGWALPGMHPGTCEDATFHRARVFSASLADWLDEEVPIEWLADFLALIHATPQLDWLLLTKRPQNWRLRLEQVWELQRSDCSWLGVDAWLDGDAPANVWIGTTAEDKDRALQRVPEALKIPARVHFLSCEPLLSDLYLSPWLTPRIKVSASLTAEQWEDPDITGALADHVRKSFARTVGIDWVICGGESGMGKGSETPRPMHPDWARSLRDQCAPAGVPFFFKQWGEFGPSTEPLEVFNRATGDFETLPPGIPVRIGKKAAGALLDGVEHKAFPEPLSSERKAVTA